MGQQIFTKIWSQIDFIMLNTYSFWGGDFGSNNIKNSKKRQKGQYLQHGSTDFHQNLTADRSHHAEYFYPCQNLVKTNCLGDICKNLLSDPLCSIFSYGGHVFLTDQKSNSQFVQDILRNNHLKFHPNLFSSFRGEDVWRNC